MPRAKTPKLVLCGRRRDRRHLAYVFGRAVWLSAGPFDLLCRLACGRVMSDVAMVSAPPMAILRLRRAMDEAAGSHGGSARLIETGDGAEYALAIPRGQVALGASFLELPVPRFLAADVAATLRARCRIVIGL